MLRNSLRTGLGLAMAVAVTHLFPLDNDFWVVLGAMSVLRSSALTTGTRVLRAVAGTAIGFLLGAIVIELVGVDPVVMWTLLPVVAFGSAFVPEVASFIAGQAAFTMMVLIIFNLIAPTGWSVGLIRVEDVVVGALVGIVVSVLLWPRGARTRCRRRSTSPSPSARSFCAAAVLRVTRGASEEATDRVIALSHDALEASRTVDDAVRQYLSESSGSTDVRAPVVRSANRAIRLRAAAELIADVVPPPPRCVRTYPQGAGDPHGRGLPAGHGRHRRARARTDQRRLRDRAARRGRRRRPRGCRCAAAGHRRSASRRTGAAVSAGRYDPPG